MKAADLVLRVPNGAQRGYAAEMVAAMHLMGLGWNVAFAAAGCGFDLIAERGGVCKTLQVKLAWNRDKGNPLVSLVTKNGATRRQQYKTDAFDSWCFVVPNDIDGSVDVCFWPLDNAEERTNMRIKDEQRAETELR